MTVGYAEYGPHVGDQDALKLSVAGAVEETGQVVAKELRVRMQAPDLTLTVRGWAPRGGGPLGSILGPFHIPWVPSMALGPLGSILGLVHVPWVPSTSLGALPLRLGPVPVPWAPFWVPSISFGSRPCSLGSILVLVNVPWALTMSLGSRPCPLGPVPVPWVPSWASSPSLGPRSCPLGPVLGPVCLPWVPSMSLEVPFWVPSMSLGPHPHPSAPLGPLGAPRPRPTPVSPRSCWRRRWWARRCRCRWSSRTHCRGR